VLRVSSPRKLRLLAGSDDAIRVWLDGALLLEDNARRPATPDQAAADLELAAGDNHLVVEISQAAGAWGMFVRLEDENGRRLELTDAGDLVPLEE
jgi:hypothetical protein